MTATIASVKDPCPRRPGRNAMLRALPLGWLQRLVVPEARAQEAAWWEGFGLPAVSCALLASVSVPTVPVAATWTVSPDGNGDAVTIQGAVDMAGSGDTILIHPGTYMETIEISNMDLVVRSSAGDPHSVVVDGSDAEEERVVRIEGVGNSVSIREVTVRGGAPSGTDGGGVLANGVHLEMEGCVVTDNSALVGAAIYVDPRGSFSVRHNVFVRNNGGFGTCVLYSHGVFENNELYDNSSTAIVCGDYSDFPQEIVVRNNRVYDNVSKPTMPAGIYLVGPSDVICESNLVYRNVGLVGGLWSKTLGSGSRIANNVFFENESTSKAGVAQLLAERNAEVRQNIIYGGVGGGLVQVVHDVHFRCNDVYHEDETVLLYHGDDLTGVDGNFSADPMFCDEETFRIREDSPCLPGQHPDGSDCGLIGVAGEGCGASPVIETSWGSMKTRYK